MFYLISAEIKSSLVICEYSVHHAFLDTFSRKDESTLFLGCKLESVAKITTRSTKILPIDPRKSQQVHHHLLLTSIGIYEYISVDHYRSWHLSPKPRRLTITTGWPGRPGLPCPGLPSVQLKSSWLAKTESTSDLEKLQQVGWGTRLWPAQLNSSCSAHFAQLKSALTRIMIEWLAPVICLNPNKKALCIIMTLAVYHHIILEMPVPALSAK